MKKYFLNIFKHDEIYIPGNSNIDKNINLNNRRDYEKLLTLIGDVNMKKIKVVLCHCNYNELNFTDTFNNTPPLKHFSLTAVRNPVSRILSHYSHLDKGVFYNNTDITDLNDNYLKEYCEMMGGLMTTRIAGGKNDLEIAKKNVHNISYIIVLENMSEEISKLNNILNNIYNCNSKIDITMRDNINNDSKYKNIDINFKRKVYDMCKNTNDYILYQYIIDNKKNGMIS